MSEAKIDIIAQYAQERFGDGNGPALSVVNWIKSAILNWAHSASITSFAPLDSYMSRDRSFDELLLELFKELVSEHEFDGVNSAQLICSTLSETLEIFRDENRNWATDRSENDEADFADASLLQATTLAVFQALQHFDSERAMRWADDLLRSGGSSIGFFSFGTQPFEITLFSSIGQKHAKSEARSGFFAALYEWAEKNTAQPQIIARFPELLLLRLESVYGAKSDEQMFDILNSLFSIQDVENLQPIQAVEKSILDDAEDFDDMSVLDEYASSLSYTAGIHTARHIRNMEDAEKRKWLESEILRNAFWTSLNSPPIDDYNLASNTKGPEKGSIMDIIIRGGGAYGA